MPRHTQTREQRRYTANTQKKKKSRNQKRLTSLDRNNTENHDDVRVPTWKSFAWNIIIIQRPLLLATIPPLYRTAQYLMVLQGWWSCNHNFFFLNNTEEEGSLRCWTLLFFILSAPLTLFALFISSPVWSRNATTAVGCEPGREQTPKTIATRVLLCRLHTRLSSPTPRSSSFFVFRNGQKENKVDGGSSKHSKKRIANSTGWQKRKEFNQQ